MFLKKSCSLGLLVGGLFLFSCSQEYTPKPKGFNRIDLPAPAFQPLETGHPYTFEFSKYAYATKDTTGLSEPHWIDIVYPDFGARISVTYKSLEQPKNQLVELTEDARRLTAKHQIRASAIDEAVLQTAAGQPAYVFELSGEVPSQFQFYTTDSTEHFLRGALYFQVASKNDSLAPVIDFIKSDIVHMLNTLHWTE
ncbi:gliding motility-associated lipoprotein GldD [Catalinimonas alkaloidigena]|uniref:Gliding motility-associated lipoprotein GldD n=1 Tax=Catalinimonas alkaloidigena TaxID=1075417 RepID=A0A1G9ETP8_9BACT|nr:gliding motility lipoprotein GldD [Catalinimonas alkaloidigena]SDK79510.1 gliding motility-associated lipoprotein GldD [Catalinimonas alkaloidigena]